MSDKLQFVAVRSASRLKEIGAPSYPAFLPDHDKLESLSDIWRRLIYAQAATKAPESASHKRMYRCKTTEPVCFPDAGGYLSQISVWVKVFGVRVCRKLFTKSELLILAHRMNLKQP